MEEEMWETGIDMEVLNLVSIYKEVLDGRRTLDQYQDQFPKLFDNYFSYWSEKDLSFSQDVKQIEVGEEILLASFQKTDKLLKDAQLDPNQINVVLFVGQGTSNGHAALLDNKWWVWLPVETYSSQLQAGVFALHEIIHGLHYARFPEFYFQSKDEKESMSRQILTEGIATFAVAALLDCSDRITLWADYLSDSKWQNWNKKYEEQEQAIATHVLENWDRSAGALFQANDPNDIMSFRGGYALAFFAVRSACAGMSVPEALGLSKDKLEERVKNFVKKKAG